jgi:TusA-related sulfurtransferase
MKTNYTLTKLSSGAMVELYTDDIYSVKTILESWCCVDCVAEANIDKEEDDRQDVYNLLYTACGAEFILEEEDVEDED